MDFQGNLKPKRAELVAVVVRADGSREELGTISYYHRNPLRRLAWWLLQRFGK